MFLFEGPTAPLVAAASLHGITDFGFGPKVFIPYAVGFAIPATKQELDMTFAIASIHHFSRDIGYNKSLLLHLLLSSVAIIDINASFIIFSLYYCGFHVPFHLCRTFKNGNRELSLITTFLILIVYKIFEIYLFDCQLNIGDRYIERLVICHVVSDIIFND